MTKQEIDLLRREVEMLVKERGILLKAVGAAAILIANSEPENIPDAAVSAAEMLSEALNALPEETLQDALQTVQRQRQ
ncbi:MAG: hypothetical protein RL358_756 [Pseudomonadota bacterium]|jgi:hypothetical protein